MPKLVTKVVILGEGRVGKSSITQRWIENSFDPDKPSTVEAQMCTKKQVFVDGYNVTINLWDTAGQEKYHALGPIYYRNADAALLVYDLTDEDTFDRVRRWIKELQKAANPNIQLVICGNKADRERDRQVTDEKAEAMARRYNTQHFSTSAKLNQNIDEAFNTLIRKIIAVKEGRLSGGGDDLLDGNGGGAGGGNDDLFGNLGGSTSAQRKQNRLRVVDDEPEDNGGGGDGGGADDYAVDAEGNAVGGSAAAASSSSSAAKSGGSKAMRTGKSTKRVANDADDDISGDDWKGASAGGGYGFDVDQRGGGGVRSNHGNDDAGGGAGGGDEGDYAVGDDGFSSGGALSSQTKTVPKKPASQPTAITKGVAIAPDPAPTKPKTINLAAPAPGAAKPGDLPEKKCAC